MLKCHGQFFYAFKQFFWKCRQHCIHFCRRCCAQFFPIRCYCHFSHLNEFRLSCVLNEVMTMKNLFAAFFSAFLFTASLFAQSSQSSSISEQRISSDQTILRAT